MLDDVLRAPADRPGSWSPLARQLLELRYLRRHFRVAAEIPAQEHFAIQAAVQRHVENAVGKTINLPEVASPDVVRGAFRNAHRLGCKGVTIYRSGTQPSQVLQVLGHCLTCTGKERVPLNS